MKVFYINSDRQIKQVEALKSLLDHYFNDIIALNSIQEYRPSSHKIDIIFATEKLDLNQINPSFLLISNCEQELKNYIRLEFNKENFKNIISFIQFTISSILTHKKQCFKDISCTYNHNIRNKLSCIQYQIENPRADKVQARLEDIKDIVKLLEKIDELQFECLYKSTPLLKGYYIIN